MGRSARSLTPETAPPRPQICPTAHARGGRDSSIPPTAQKPLCAPVWPTPAKIPRPCQNKECPLATPSACRARIAFDLTGTRVGLRSRHSAPWAVAGSGVESQAIRHPRPLLFAPAGPEANAFSKSLTSLENQKGEPLPEAVGDNVPQGGRPGEGAQRLRTGGPAWSPPGRSVGGTAKPWQTPTPCHSDAAKESPKIREREIF